MDYIIEIITVLCIVIFSMMLHELAHGLVAYLLGDDTAKNEGRLTLNPLKHLDLTMSVIVPMVLFLIGAPVFGGAKPVPINRYKLKFGEWGMALVALAGPATNFLIALISFLVGYWTGALNNNGIGGFVIVELIMVNLGFMIFNLIPLPPLDGSRLLYAIAPDSVRNIMLKMESVGVILVYAMIFLFGSAFSAVMVWGINGILNSFLWLVGM